MLFLGTNKYPLEDEFEGYLNPYGGSSNAYTDMQDTNYYFGITSASAALHQQDDNDDDEELEDENDDEDEEEEEEVTAAQQDAWHGQNAISDMPRPSTFMVSVGLQGALDHFAQFFVAPTFAPDAVEREVAAIDSKYANLLASDARRNYQLLKWSCHAQHAFSKFGCGNAQTLTTTNKARDELRRFWQTYYQASNMRVSVVAAGNTTLDDLQWAVEQTFGEVRPGPGPEAVAVEEEDQHQQQRETSPPPAPVPKDTLFASENVNPYGNIAAFGPDQVGIFRQVVPVKEVRLLKFLWVVPPTEYDATMRRTQPQAVFSHLLGHESPHTLHDVLLQRGWIQSLSSGNAVAVSDFSLFGLTLSLTRDGLQHLQEVLDLTWQWIGKIRRAIAADEESHMAQYHNELRQVARLHFQFQEVGDATDFCSAAAEEMFFFAQQPEKVLTGSSLAFVQDYNATVEQAFAERIRPSNCLLSLWNPNAHAESEKNATGGFVEDYLMGSHSASWQEEPWYKAQFRQVKIPPELAVSWESASLNDDDSSSPLQLPPLNTFIPTDFSLRCNDAENKETEEEETKGTTTSTGEAETTRSSTTTTPPPTLPTLLVDSPGRFQLWHQMDRTFRVPKTTVKVKITTPHVYATPRSMTLNRLFAKVLDKDLNSYTYNANMAGCHYHVAVVPTGWRLSVSGYSQTLPSLLQVVTTRIPSLIAEMKRGESSFLATLLDKARDGLERETRNYQYESPYETAHYISRLVLETPLWHVHRYLRELEETAITLEECGAAAEVSWGLTAPVRAQVLCMGNVHETQARQVGDVVAETFLGGLADGAAVLEEEQVPQFYSLQVPTRFEAAHVWGLAPEDYPSWGAASLVVQQVVQHDQEVNHAVELLYELGSEATLGYRGIAVVDLLTHLAYNSAYDCLRTKEQLGYMVSATTRKTMGHVVYLSIVVQSNTATPPQLQSRCEAWMETFGQEVAQISSSQLEQEVAGLVALLLEPDATLRESISSTWGTILSTVGVPMEPHATLPWDRLEQVAAILRQESVDTLQHEMMQLFSTRLQDPHQRRVLAAHVYGKDPAAQDEFEAHVGQPGVVSNWTEILPLKSFLMRHSNLPYWAATKQ